MTTTPALPPLLDRKGIQRELGVSRHVAERLMRRLPTVVIPGVRKVFVRREAVLAALTEWTHENGEIRR